MLAVLYKDEVVLTWRDLYRLESRTLVDEFIVWLDKHPEVVEAVITKNSTRRVRQLLQAYLDKSYYWKLIESKDKRKQAAQRRLETYWKVKRLMRRYFSEFSAVYDNVRVSALVAQTKRRQYLFLHQVLPHLFVYDSKNYYFFHNMLTDDFFRHMAHVTLGRDIRIPAKKMFRYNDVYIRSIYSSWRSDLFANLKWLLNKGFDKVFPVREFLWAASL